MVNFETNEQKPESYEIGGFTVNPAIFCEAFLDDLDLKRRPDLFSRWWGVVFLKSNDNGKFNVYRADAATKTGISLIALDADESQAIQAAKIAQIESMRVCAFCRYPSLSRAWKKENGHCTCPICNTTF